MHPRGRIVGPGHPVELFQTGCICYGDIQLVLSHAKDALAPFPVLGIMFFQFPNSPGTDGIAGKRIECSGVIGVMQ